MVTATDDVILIENATAHPIYPTYGVAEKAQALRIMPGINRVERAPWDAVKASKMVAGMLARDELVELLDKGEITGITVTRAVRVVKGTLDKALLRQWHTEDSRQPVRAAIAEQLKLLDGSKPEPELGAQPTEVAEPPPAPRTGGVDVSAPRSRRKR